MPAPRPAAGPPDDHAQFEELFARCHRAVFEFFVARGFSRDRASDLTQETFLKVYRGLPSYRHEASPETWVLRIAVNVWKNEIRRRRTAKRDAAMVELEVVAAGAADAGAASLVAGDPTPDRLLAESDLRRSLARAVSLLAPRTRRCLDLYLAGEKYQEIATALGISIDTVKSHLGQAKARLRRELSTAEGSGAD